MNICPICGKPRVPIFNNGTYYYTVSTTTQTNTVPLNYEYCLGMCSGITATNIIATIQVNGVVLPVYDVHMETTPIEEKPLEWSEVERQLDDFMDELNERET